MASTIQYDVSNFPNGFNAASFKVEIERSGIVTALEEISTAGTVVFVKFKTDLPHVDKVILDGDPGDPPPYGGLVAAHSGKPLADEASFAFSNMGNLKVEAVKPTGGGSIRVSHDYCKPITWYGDSDRIVDEILGCPMGDGINFRADYKYWICLTQGLVTSENDIINDTATWPNGPFNVEIKVNDIVKVEGVDYKVDYLYGEVSFLWPNPFNTAHNMGMGPLAPTDVVKATYSRATTSTWYLRPAPGKTLLISNTELQFSQNNRMSSAVIFAPWIFYPPLGQMIPVPGDKTIYKRMTDLVNEGNKGTGSIAPMGGDKRGLRYPVSVFPFDYLTNKPLASSLQAELRTYIENHIPVDGEYATVTCYCMEIDDPDYVPQ